MATVPKLDSTASAYTTARQLPALRGRTIGEFDGKIKYGRMLKSGQAIEDVLFAEKRREDALRDLGWQIVRWLWADLYRRGVIRDRVLRALARSR